MSGDYDEGEHKLLLKVDASEAMYDALVLLLSYENGGTIMPTLARGVAVDRARVALAKAEGRI